MIGIITHMTCFADGREVLSFLCANRPHALQVGVPNGGGERRALVFNAFIEDCPLKTRSFARQDSSPRHRIMACCTVRKGDIISNFLHETLSLTAAMIRIVMRQSKQWRQSSADPSRSLGRIKKLVESCVIQLAPLFEGYYVQCDIPFQTDAVGKSSQDFRWRCGVIRIEV